MTETAKTGIRSEEKFLKVTRSRRNVAWSGIGALIVVVVLFRFPYFVGPGTTGIMIQGLIVLLVSTDLIALRLLRGTRWLVPRGRKRAAAPDAEEASA